MKATRIITIVLIALLLGACTNNVETKSVPPSSSHAAKTDPSTTSGGTVFDSRGWLISAVPSTDELQVELLSVSCPAVGDCYAAGFSFLGDGLSYPPARPGLGDRPVIEHLKGATWSMMPVSSTPGILNSITCVTREDCVAVGDTQRNYQTLGTTLVESFNGNAWTVESSSSLSSAAFAGTPAAGPPTDQIQNVLDGVACRTATECFAVGNASVALTGDSIVTEPITLRLDGASWVPTSIVTPLAEFSDVACNLRVCLAIGRSSNDLRTEVPFAAALSGATWVQTPPPVGEFAAHGVTCAAATCLALAYTGSAEVYSGGPWTSQDLPSASAQMTTWSDLACSGATKCAAVGQDNSAEGRTGLNPLAWDKTLVATLSNGTWSIENSPNRADMDDALFGVSCPAWSKCVAVGYSQVPTGLDPGRVSALALSQ
jgi:hypothetical protein